MEVVDKKKANGQSKQAELKPASFTSQEVDVFNEVFKVAIEKYAGNRQVVAAILDLEGKVGSLVEPLIEKPAPSKN